MKIRIGETLYPSKLEAAKAIVRAIEAPWDDRLRTSVDRLEYDFIARSGQLWLPPSCCTDMTGAIELFSAIDSRVEMIATFAGSAVDVVYVRQSKTDWICLDQRAPVEKP